MEALGEPEDVPPVQPGRWREMVEVLDRAESRRRWIRRAPWAAAAAVLLALAWLLPRRPAPVPLPASNPRPEALYLAPDCCLIPEKGTRLTREGDRLRLESGTLEWINRGWTTVALETPFGLLRGEAVEATISVSERKAAFWLREAQASEPSLTVEVREGRLTFGGTEIPAGKAATVSGGGIHWREIPRRELPAPDGRVQAVSGNPGLLPFPSAGTLELEVRALSPSTSLGLAFPAGGGVRMWHLQDSGAGAWRRLRISARGDWAEGWMDGRRLLSTTRASRQLQDPPGREAGLYVWGQAEVRAVRVEALP